MGELCGMTQHRDEFSICTLTLGKTRTEDLQSELSVWGDDDGPRTSGLGLVVGNLHYYTTSRRKACIAVEMRDGLLCSVRLKLGFWGPLTELERVPPEAISDCSLECLGTGHRLHLAGARTDDTRDRALEVYGTPATETRQTLQYRWEFGPFPRALTVTLNTRKRVQELFLERLPDTEVQALRPLSLPDAEMPRILSGHLGDRLAVAETLLHPAAVEAALSEILQVLEEDDPVNPSFSKAYVRARRALAAAQLGRADALDELQSCQRYLAQWDGPDGFFTLAVGLMACRAHRVLRRDVQARAGADALWNTLQASTRFHEPSLQAVARQVAAFRAET